MYYSKKLKWLKPYIDLARPIVPDLHKVTKVLAFNVQSNLKRKPTYEAKLTHDLEDDSFTISMYLDFIHKKKIHPEAEFEIIPHTKRMLLANLAHEIAHLVHWTHTPDHQILECMLNILFMTKLKQEGYISEEESEGISY